MDKILIANRGEIARRIMRTCREMGIATVAVFAEPDRNSLFVSEADQAVALGGAAAGESYLRIDAILDAARRSGADAIHPGYGFLAENADFARACAEQKITLIGPTPEAIALMGSKIEAKRRMIEAGVPVLPSLELGDQSAETLAREVEKLAFPLLVKASAGGGGRGMRLVQRQEDLAASIAAAEGEAAAAFGDGTVFIEPYLESPRHVEIQILGDADGNVIHLFERECSIQRRHQKILEEAPSPAVDETLRRAMGETAVRAAKAISYRSAGTVEFLLTPEGKFYFLEMNTRLQVEHPVTECITGLDLVRLQILIARGEPLPAEAFHPRIDGHAIEVRLYAEDAQHDFAPTTGTLHRFHLPETAGVRVEAGFADGDEISPFYDSMLAKMIAHAPTREEAARRLARALTTARIHGPKTNRDLLVRLLGHEDFLAGRTDTHFLMRHRPEQLGRPLFDARGETLHAAAAALAMQAQRRAKAKVLKTVPSGWRNNPSTLQHTKYQGATDEIDIGYRFKREGLVLEVNGDRLPRSRLLNCTPSGVTLEVDGVSRVYEVQHVGETVYVDSPLGGARFTAIDRFPPPEAELAAGSLVAPLPGVVNEIKVTVGAVVEAGDVLIVIESMKMLHEVSSPTSGKVAEIYVEPAGHVEAGMVLVVIADEHDE